MSLKKVIKINKWTESIKNSNEKRVKEYIRSILPEYKAILWDEEKFCSFYIDVLNSLPTRYKQKNSIEISGRIKKDVIMDAIRERLDEILRQESPESVPKLENLPEEEPLKDSNIDSIQEEDIVNKENDIPSLPQESSIALTENNDLVESQETPGISDSLKDNEISNIEKEANIEETTDTQVHEV